MCKGTGRWQGLSIIIVVTAAVIYLFIFFCLSSSCELSFPNLTAAYTLKLLTVPFSLKRPQWRKTSLRWDIGRYPNNVGHCIGTQ